LTDPLPFSGFGYDTLGLTRRTTMPPRVGKQAPDFTLKDHTSKEIRLRDYRGKNVVLAFFPLAWTPV